MSKRGQSLRVVIADDEAPARSRIRDLLEDCAASFALDVVGEAAAWLQDGMTVMLSTHDGVPIALELPRLLTLEITDTEPAVKNQTASSSYKPAKASNGMRILIPPYMGAGERVLVSTETGEYMRRAD